MKKYILPVLILALSLSVSAQNEQDALRLSQIFHGGSARSLGMGGAIGAVGVDFGAIAINPAASGLYRRGDFSMTTGFSNVSTDANFLDVKSNDAAYSMNLNQIGFVMPFKTKPGSDFGIKGLNFSFGYNKLRDYNQNIVMSGINQNNSLVDEFVYTANMNDDWDPFTDELAWETWLIDYDSIAGVFYSDFDVSGYGQTQRRSVKTSGSLGEYVFNLGANVGDKVYFGGSIGIQRYRYEETWVHTELDPDDIIDYFESFRFSNQLETQGSGFNAKFGVIAQPVSWIRIGASIHTPTFFKLKDNFTSSIQTDLADGEPTHEYTAYGEFDYEITTPFRAVGSVALFYKNRAMLSLDYEFVDYSNARLSGDDYEFYDENQAVSNRYGTASNVRVGAEVVFAPFYVRAGYSFYGSPYVTGEANENMINTSISGGLGFRTNRISLDFAIVQSSWEQQYYLYGSNVATLDASALRFVGTLGFRF